MNIDGFMGQMRSLDGSARQECFPIHGWSARARGILMALLLGAAGETRGQPVPAAPGASANTDPRPARYASAEDKPAWKWGIYSILYPHSARLLRESIMTAEEREARELAVLSMENPEEHARRTGASGPPARLEELLEFPDRHPEWAAAARSVLDPIESLEEAERQKTPSTRLREEAIREGIVSPRESAAVDSRRGSPAWLAREAEAFRALHQAAAVFEERRRLRTTGRLVPPSIHGKSETKGGQP